MTVYLTMEEATFCDPAPFEVPPFGSTKAIKVREASDAIWAIISDSGKWNMEFEFSLFVARSAIENLYKQGFRLVRPESS